MSSDTNHRGNVVAIIPARGGSKGLPGKNILPLMGKPVLAYTAEAARQAATLDRVILSSDSPEIAEVAKAHGIEVPFLRPAHLATDTSHPTAAIEHLLSFLEEEEGYETEIVVTLQPTSPLRLPEHIDQAVNLLRENTKLDSVITVQEVVLPPFWMLLKDCSRLRPFIDDGVDYSLIRRQDLERVYKPNGAVYATRRQLLREKGVIFSAFSGGNTGYVVMDQATSLEIDTRTDFMVIEAVMKGQA